MIFTSPRQSIAIDEMPLPHFVFKNAKSLGNKPAFIDGESGRTITFAEAVEKVERLCSGLCELGFGKGDIIALFIPTLPEYPIVVHAAIMAGGTVTTVNPVASASDLEQQLKATGAKCLVTTSALLRIAQEAARASGLTTIITLEETEGAIPLQRVWSSKAALPEVFFDVKEDTAALPFSSGTTGLPKGVMLTHYNMVANINQFIAAGFTTIDDVALSIPPLFHIFGWTVVTNALPTIGTTAITMPRFDLEQFLRLIQDHRVTQIFVVPPIVQLLAKHPLVDKYNLSSLKNIVCAGAPLSAEVSEACAQRLGCNILQGYGMTEAGPITHAGYRTESLNRQGTGGHLYANTECRVVCINTQKDLGTEEEGEIWVKGPQIMKGYLNNPEATRNILDDSGWLRTGDVGRIDSDGYLKIVDRIKELIKYKGFQVAPAELEGLLLTHPAVSDVAVIPEPDEEAGEVPLAVVVKKSMVSEKELLEFVADKVTSYKRIRRVEFVSEIPKTPSGKILRRTLIEQRKQRDLVVSACASSLTAIASL